MISYGNRYFGYGNKIPLYKSSRSTLDAFRCMSFEEKPYSDSLAEFTSEKLSTISDKEIAIYEADCTDHQWDSASTGESLFSLLFVENQSPEMSLVNNLPTIVQIARGRYNQLRDSSYRKDSVSTVDSTEFSDSEESSCGCLLRENSNDVSTSEENSSGSLVSLSESLEYDSDWKEIYEKFDETFESEIDTYKEIFEIVSSVPIEKVEELYLRAKAVEETRRKDFSMDDILKSSEKIENGESTNPRYVPGNPWGVEFSSIEIS